MTWQIALVSLMLVALASLPDVVQGQETVESGHLAVENPAELSQSVANRIYDELRAIMSENYALSRMSVVEDYQSWRRYNSAPYVSATHGQRFVNNYANITASDYGSLPAGQAYPAGSVLAKDSMTIMDNGKIYPGALSVMEKLATGSSPDTADWRYLVILPDGTLFGDTVGEEAEQVDYCHACHAARASKDFVFFVPDEFLIK